MFGGILGNKYAQVLETIILFYYQKIIIIIIQKKQKFFQDHPKFSNINQPTGTTVTTFY